MGVMIQRVNFSQIKVNGEIVGKIGKGLNIFVGIATTDTEVEIDWMVRKCLDIRLFPDLNSDNSRWEKSVKDIDALVRPVHVGDRLNWSTELRHQASLGFLPQTLVE